jgi:RimJ/RimL family protein N-acetyltransferase
MSITFRTATIDDCDLMFLWANDVETRKNAFNSALIEYEDHVRWFNKLNFNNVLIFSNENAIPVGLARIDEKDCEWVITTMVDATQRGKGYGVKIIQLSPVEFFKRNASINNIIAYIKETNLISLKTFSKGGFVLESTLNIGNFPCYKMSFNREK